MELCLVKIFHLLRLHIFFFDQGWSWIHLSLSIMVVFLFNALHEQIKYYLHTSCKQKIKFYIDIHRAEYKSTSVNMYSTSNIPFRERIPFKKFNKNPTLKKMPLRESLLYGRGAARKIPFRERIPFKKNAI